mmetsp:Transcript_23205/g.38416  ORF Transcript_23205/g.38416 Transcript_23205/m.38416 type:complete len:293 (-) Transcript_23205:209-1087(-)
MEEDKLKQIFHAKSHQRLRQGIREGFEHFNIVHAELGAYQQRSREILFSGYLDSNNFFPVAKIHLFNSRAAINCVIDLSHRQSSQFRARCEGTHTHIRHHLANPRLGETNNLIIVVWNFVDNFWVLVLKIITILLGVNTIIVSNFLIIPKGIIFKLHFIILARVAIRLGRETNYFCFLQVRNEDSFDTKVITDILAVVEMSHESIDKGRTKLLFHVWIHDSVGFPFCHVAGVGDLTPDGTHKLRDAGSWITRVPLVVGEHFWDAHLLCEAFIEIKQRRWISSSSWSGDSSSS